MPLYPFIPCFNQYPHRVRRNLLYLPVSSVEAAVTHRPLTSYANEVRAPPSMAPPPSSPLTTPPTLSLSLIYFQPSDLWSRAKNRRYHFAGRFAKEPSYFCRIEPAVPDFIINSPCPFFYSCPQSLARIQNIILFILNQNQVPSIYKIVTIFIRPYLLRFNSVLIHSSCIRFVIE